MFEIWVNGELEKFEERISLAQLIELNGLTQKKIAIEINEEIIPASSHRSTELSPGDKVEIVQAIGGG